MQRINIYRREPHHSAADLFCEAGLVSADRTSVLLEVDKWIPPATDGSLYFLDAGSAGEPEDIVTMVNFAPTRETTLPFHLKGTLFQGVTCRKAG